MSIDAHPMTAPDLETRLEISRPMTDTRWLDGSDVILFAHDMLVTARYCPGEWSADTPNGPAEYSGAVWSCFDDEFQFEIEEISSDPSDWLHSPVKGWLPATELRARAERIAALEAERAKIIQAHLATDASLKEADRLLEAMAGALRNARDDLLWLEQNEPDVFGWHPPFPSTDSETARKRQKLDAVLAQCQAWRGRKDENS